jgi:hypothetical protein
MFIRCIFGAATAPTAFRLHYLCCKNKQRKKQQKLELVEQKQNQKCLFSSQIHRKRMVLVVDFVTKYLYVQNDIFLFVAN